MDSPDEGNNPEGADRPEWLPDNFKTPEDLLKSYQEAQNKIREQGTQLNALNDNYATLSNQFAEFSTQQAQPDPADAQAQLYAAYENDPVQATINIAQQVAQQTARELAQQQTAQQGQVPADVAAFMADQTLSAKYDDWGEHKAKIAEHIQTDPFVQNDQIWTNPALATQALDRAYKTVKAEAVLENPEQYGQQQADLARRMKLQAQSAVGAGGRPDPVAADKAEWDRIMGAAPKRYYE